MDLIMTIIGIPLGYIMWGCYLTVKNYGIAVILFTLVTKILLFPVSLKIQKNSIKLVQMRPKIEALKRLYPNKEDKEAFMEAQLELYAQEKYSPAAGCLPMLIQLPIILGLIDVIYKPLKHLFHFHVDVITSLESSAMKILNINDLGISTQLKVIEAINNPKYIDDFLNLSTIGGQKSELVIQQIQDIDLNFGGLDLSSIPSLAEPGNLIVIPVLAGVSALLLSILQNRGGNVLQAEQGVKSQFVMTLFLTAFSVYFTFLVPAGIGLYWIASNVLAIVQMYLLNIIYNPQKFIDYAALEKMKQDKNDEKNKGENISDRGTSHRQRERHDYKEFFKQKNKQVVFYSEKSGFYKYFQSSVEALIKNSEITIHYVTSDPNDSIFNMNHKQIKPYYIGSNRLIPFMMKMDAAMVLMTMPDLEQMHIKRSLVRDDIEYLYIFHGVLSTHMVLRKGALDNYDTIFCVGSHQIAEIRETEKLYNLKPKKLIECGYGVIEKMREDFLSQEITERQKKNILVAPSWQRDNILETCLDDMLENIVGKGHCVILRPHPEYIKRHRKEMNKILEKFSPSMNEDFQIELDFTSSVTIFNADILITDWSNIAYEFSFATRKPAIFINTPMKVMNPEYTRLSMEPLDISLRNEMGISLELSEVKHVEDYIEKLLGQATEYSEKIDAVVDKYFFTNLNSGVIISNYITETLATKKSKV